MAKHYKRRKEQEEAVTIPRGAPTPLHTDVIITSVQGYASRLHDPRQQAAKTINSAWESTPELLLSVFTYRVLCCVLADAAVVAILVQSKQA